MKELTIQDVETIVHRDETRVMEAKETTGELVKGMQSGCAFLNSDGGWLFFGIHPTKLTILGQDVADRTRQEIATALFKGGEMEGWGRGIPDIYDLCKASGMPEPEFDFVPNYVCLTIRFKTPLRLYVSGDVNGDVNGRLNGRLNPTQQTVYDSIIGHPGIKAKDISAKYKIQIDTLNKVIRALTEMNLIERLGSRKTGGYYPVKQ